MKPCVETTHKESLLSTALNLYFIDPIALRMAKTLWSFGHSECKRVKAKLVSG